MKLIIGLGNPGKKYEKTRHNVGFLVLNQLRDTLEKNNDISAWSLSKKFNAEVCDVQINQQKIVLAKPMTFMNDSGHAVSLLQQFYDIGIHDIIVVHDDKDLPLGTIKAQEERGHAGHNGVRSLIECLGSKQFTRVRVGIAGKHMQKMKNTSDFVLGKFSLLERGQLKNTIAEAVITVQNMLH